MLACFPANLTHDAAVAVIDDIIRAEVAMIRASGLFMPEWYLVRHPEIAATGDDGVVHFCKFGWRYGAQPNPYFSPEFYIANNPDVAADGVNPLLHYHTHGDAEGRDPSPFFHVRWYRGTYGLGPAENCLRHFLARRGGGQVSPVPLFDAAWYLETNPDVKAGGADPFEHFLAFGPAEGRDPSPEFDVRFYVNRYGTVLNGQNPLLHYLANRESGYLPVRPAHEEMIPGAIRAATRPAAAFETLRPLPLGAAPEVKLLAFYLPQFHRVAENDAWWGQGFTDWTNLGRALPRFAGHLQPRVPRDLGFYSLDDPATLRRQIAMALGAGLSGFVFYFYWFNGKRLLEKPLAQLTGDASLDFPFCVMWANENWTRRWDGLEREVLIAQEYRSRDDAALIGSFAALFADRRYIRVQGRPLLMIYRVTLVPDAARRIAAWRTMFAELHDENPLIVMAQSLGDFDPAPYGLDGAVEFPPHKLGPEAERLNDGLDLLDPNFSATVYDYEAIAEVSLAIPPPKFPLIKTIVPGWDNDPRREGQGLVLHKTSPQKYQAWLERLVDYTAETPFYGERILCVNAWNEWAEGAFLEPDLHFGAAYLNATGRALCRRGTAARPGAILLVGHDAHPHGAQLLLLHLARLLRRRFGFDVHILLLGVGALLGRYHQAGDVSVAYDKTIIGNLLDTYRAAGIRTAIVNSAAAARVVPWAAARGMECTLLIHEMPRLLQEYNLEVQTRLGIAAAARTVFSSDFVRGAVAAALEIEPAGIVLPQGNYQRIGFDDTARTRIRAALGIAPGDFMVLGVGFADFRKGFDLFMQIARRLMRTRADVHFVWAGDVHFTLATYLAPEIAAATETGAFHHVPFTEAVADYYAAADVYALTSREDPYPTTVLEALACGVMCVAFEGAGGIPDLLRAVDGGHVVAAGEPEAFGNAVEALLDKTALAAARPRLCELAAKKFDFGRYAEDLMRIVQPDLRTVSVAVLNYNYEAYLAGRLQSIFAQSYPVHEVLFLDDASTDDSVALAAAVAQGAGRELTSIVNPRNAGSVFAQWRRAAAAATGEYIWIAEADDLAEPQFLERLVEAMAAAEAPLLAFSDSRAVDAAGTLVTRSYHSYYVESGATALTAGGVWEAKDFARYFLAARNLILNVSAVLWRRPALLAALDAAAGRLPEFQLAGDWLLYLTALTLQKGSVVVVAAPLNTHRRHQASVTGRLDAERHLAEIRALHRIAAETLKLDAAARTRQAAYAALIEEQFGLAKAAPPRPRKSRRSAAIIATKREV